MRAFLIRESGETELVELPTFEDVQKACGGTRPNAVLMSGGGGELVTGMVMERVIGRIVESPSILTKELRHLTMWCNEEAQLEGLQANHKATILVGWWGAEYPDGSLAMLRGDVVIDGPTDRNGDRTGLSDEDAVLLGEHAGRIVLLRH